MMAFFTAAIAALCVRIGYLQLYSDDTLAVMASGQYLSELGEAAERAGICDRSGVEITGGEKYALYYIDNEALKEEGDGLLEKYRCEEIGAHGSGGCVWRGAYNEKQIAAIEESYGAVSVVCRERYSDEQPAAHLIGYVGRTGEGGKQEGQCGLEKLFEERLEKGTVRKYLYRDAVGNYLNGSGIFSDSEISEPFCTTIDLGLQREAEEILEENGNPGGILVSTADTGEILAYASYPVYNPNDVAASLNSSGSELTDRLSGASYPPGSVFKVVVAAAAMEAGIADEDSVFECRGSVDAGGISVRCSTGGESGHGNITLKEALAKSCNCAFIELGVRTGGDAILEMAGAMGFGRDACGQIWELTGNLPENASECGIADLSIGQGNLLVTPLQVTAMMRTVADGGVYSPLEILTEQTREDLVTYGLSAAADSDGESSGRMRVMSKSTAASLLSMLCGTADFGTAKSLSDYTEASAGGKTGSAQSTMSGRDVVHGWFSGFYPQEDPEYVITVFMEDGGGGGSCVPAAGTLIDYLSRNDRLAGEN